MSFEEKNTWAFGVIATVGYLTYLVIVLGRRSAAGLVETPYVGPMLATIGGAIVAGILTRIALTAAGPAEPQDQRDREIYRWGENIGQAFLTVGGVGALVLAMVEAPHFWIANLLYLCFVLSAILATVAKLVAYRRGFQTW